MRTLQQIKEELQKLESKHFKTKAARQKNWDKIRALKYEAFPILEKLKDELTAQYFKKEELTITLVSNNWCYAENENFKTSFQPQNDIHSASWYAETCCIEYTEGQKIKAIVAFEIDLDTLQVVYFLRDIEGGILNKEKYIALRDSDRNLAFFKYNLLDGDNSISSLIA